MVSGIKVEITKEKLFEEYVIKDKTLTEIAREINCSISTIKNKIKKYEITLKRCKKSDWKNDFIRLCYPIFENKSIAKIVEFSPQKVGKIANKFGLVKSRSIFPGDKFGKLTILDEQKYINKALYWNCQCECGNTKFVRQTSLIQRDTESCGCIIKDRNKTELDIIPYWFFSLVMKSAKYRDIPFLITIEELEKILISQNFCCALTKIPLKIGEKQKTIKENKLTCTASVDRKDNSKGYTKENCQFLHTNINDMKGSMPQDYLINLCKLVANNNECEIDNDLMNNYKKVTRTKNSYRSSNKNIN